MTDSTSDQDSSEAEYREKTKSEDPEVEVDEEDSVGQEWVGRLEEAVARSGAGQLIDDADAFERSATAARIGKVRAQDLVLEDIEIDLKSTEAEEEDEPGSRWEWLKDLTHDRNTWITLIILLANQLAVIGILLLL